MSYECHVGSVLSWQFNNVDLIHGVRIVGFSLGSLQKWLYTEPFRYRRHCDITTETDGCAEKWQAWKNRWNSYATIAKLQSMRTASKMSRNLAIRVLRALLKNEDSKPSDFWRQISKKKAFVPLPIAPREDWKARWGLYLWLCAIYLFVSIGLRDNRRPASTVFRRSC